MINAYDKIYLDRARKTLATMLDFAVNDLGYDIDSFFDLFISSGIAMRFENGEPSVVVGKSGVEIAYEVIQKEKGITERKAPTYAEGRSEEYWTGWAICYYQWKTSLKFSEIVKIISLSNIRMLYSPYHEMDIEQFVDKLNELYLEKNKDTRLKARRTELSLSQQELADISGVPKRTIQQYEQRQKSISKANAEYLVRLSKALCCNVADLIDII